MSCNPMIFLAQVGFAYPGRETPALVDISFQVQPGEWIALVGSNGSGKSTLARILNALLVPTQGACFIQAMDTRDDAHLWEIRRQLSMVFQNPENQIVSTVVQDDAAFGPENLGLPAEEIQRRVASALEVTELTEQADRAVYTLSGGQKQRLAIAGALTMNSACLVLDEPTAMLDPEGRLEVVELLHRLHRQGITVIQVSHYLEEVMEADRVLVLHHGRLDWQGTPEELIGCADMEERWDLELPRLVKLRNLLVEAGLIPAETETEYEHLLEALCPLR